MRKIDFLPCIPTRGTKVPASKNSLHEVKHDGYRLIIQRDGKPCACSPATATTRAIGFR
jgi:bifunctional non-homologous end joining protein LigD